MTDSHTPLSAAAEAGHVDMVSFLLARGANVLERNSNGDSALHVAATCGHAEVARLIIQRQPLCINAVNMATGDTPLHVATKAKQYAVSRVLLELGANSDALNKRNEPPAMAQLEQEVRAAHRSVGTVVACMPLPRPAKAAIFQVRAHVLLIPLSFPLTRIF